jgi:hypothetical protein
MSVPPREAEEPHELLRPDRYARVVHFFESVLLYFGDRLTSAQASNID